MKKKIYNFIFFSIKLLILISYNSKDFLHAENKNNFPPHRLEVIYDSGMFAMFAAVLGALDQYEKKQIEGMTVNFNRGLYLDPSKGPNWWEYFFEPIDLGNKNLPFSPTSMDQSTQLAYSGLSLNKMVAYNLIQKYIHIKPDVQSEINSFLRENYYGHYVIGVHHRGTDKSVEWPLVAFERTVQEIFQIMNKLTDAQRANARIYVATDDQFFLNYIVSLFPSQVIYNQFARSTDGTPLHIGNEYLQSNYEKGKEALIDCILLSQCQVLIRPASSCLSLASTFFNPFINVIALKPWKS